MKRVLFYALVAVIAGGNLAAEPTWAQKRGSDQDGRQKGEKSGGKRDKKGGKQGGKKGQRQPQRGQSKQAPPLQQIVQAMHQELNLSEEQAAQIRDIFDDFKSPGRDGDRKPSKSEREELASRLRELQEEARKANTDGDRERAREILQERHELKRGPKESSDKQALDPKMLEAIAKVLDDKQRPQFWRIVDRYSAQEKNDLRVRFLPLLQELDLSEEQGADISRLYEDYLDELKTVDENDRKAVKETQHRFQEAVMEQLTEEQQTAFEDALEKSELKRKEKPRGGGKAGGKRRGSGGKGAKPKGGKGGR